MFNAVDAERGLKSHQYHQQLASIGFRGDGLQLNIVPVPLAQGVTLLTGSSHNSLLIEQSRRLILVEAPLNEPRSEAILAFLRANFPNKPLEFVVATHWHQDHSAGLRTFVAEGATIVISTTTAAFFSRVFADPSTVVPDRQSAARKRAKLLTVAPNGRLTLDDGAHPLTLVPIATTHSGDMLGAYVTDAKLVFEADLFSPPLPPFPNSFARELFDAIVASRIDVATIAPVHGTPVPLDDLKRVLGIQ